MKPHRLLLHFSATSILAAFSSLSLSYHALAQDINSSATPKKRFESLPSKIELHQPIPGKLLVRLKPEIERLSGLSILQKIIPTAKARAFLMPEQSVLNTAVFKQIQKQRIQQNSSNSAFPTLQEMIDAEEPLLRSYVVEYSTNEHPISLVKKLNALSEIFERVEAVFPDQLLRDKEISVRESLSQNSALVTPNDPQYNNQFFLRQIQAPEAWDVFNDASSIVIGIVDSGCDQQHEDLKNSIAINSAEIPGNGLDDDANGYVDDYAGYNFVSQLDGSQRGNTYSVDSHGSSCAGIAAAKTNNGIGVASTSFSAKFFPTKNLPDNGNGSIVLTYDAVMYMALRGVKVLSCSWGNTTYSDFNQSVINFAVSRDVAICAGAGNDGLQEEYYPAGYKGVLGVANCDGNDKFSGTNFGVHAKIVAPGNATFTTGNSGTYVPFSGTSGATPIVAGALALVRAKYPNLTAQQALEHVRLSVDNIESSNQSYTGFVPGRLNLLKAVSRNPFSTPGLQFLNWSFKKTTGQATERVAVGDTALLRMSWRNLLGAATNCTFKLSFPQDFTGTFSSTKDTIFLPSLSRASSSSDSLVLENFTLIRKTSNTEPVVARIDISGTGENGLQFTDFVLVKIRAAAPFANFSNGEISFTSVDNGRIGYVESKDGIGIYTKQFPFNSLYEGGLYAIDKTSGKAVSSVNNDFLSLSDDFEVVKPFSEPNRTLNVLRDTKSTAPIGLEIERTVVFPANGLPIAALRHRIKNISGQTLQNIGVGYYFDWDLSRDTDSNSVALFQASLPAEWSSKASFGKILRVNASPQIPFMYQGALALQGGEVQVCGISVRGEGNSAFGTSSGFSAQNKIGSLTNGTSLMYSGVSDVAMMSGVLFSGQWLNGEMRAFDLIFGSAANDQEWASTLSSAKNTLTPVALSVNEELYPEDENFHLITPNPAASSIQLNIPREANGKTVEVKIISVQGSILISEKFLVGEPIHLDISVLQNGAYTCEIIVLDNAAHKLSSRYASRFIVLR